MNLVTNKQKLIKKYRQSQISLTVGVLAQLVSYLNHQKFDVDRIFQSVEVNPSILDSPLVRIPIENHIAIIDKAAYVTCDPYFGLHVGEFFEVSSYTILGHIMMNCKSLGQGIEKFDRYSWILGNFFQGGLEIKHNKLCLSVPQYSHEFNRHFLEAIVTSAVQMARFLCGKETNPIEVGFPTPWPDSTEEYVRVFQCPVLFEQKSCYIIAETSLFNMPVLFPNLNLLEYFENYAKDYIASCKEVKDMTHEVIKHIKSQLDKKCLSESNIAKTMSMSTRTLQVYLQKEGTKFSKLVQISREQLAKKYLKDNYSVEDITYLLGFSYPSVFRNSFKKWTGYTPKEYHISLKLPDTMINDKTSRTATINSTSQKPF